jgi:hypothetical protein
MASGFAGCGTGIGFPIRAAVMICQMLSALYAPGQHPRSGRGDLG